MKIKFLPVVFILCWVHAQSQNLPYISLQNLIHQIETNYPAILQYQYNIQALDARVEGSKAWMPPSLTVGAMQFPYDLSAINNKDDPMNQASIYFAVEQMLPNPRKLEAKKNYLSSLSEIQKSKREWTKNELRRDAKYLYYKRYVSERKQSIIKESEAVLKLILATAEEKYSNNQSQLQTIYKARARLAELNNMLLMLDGVIAESNTGLNILMVREVESPFLIDSFILPQNYTGNFINKDSLSFRSDIVSISQTIQSMKFEQEIMKIGVRPDFGIRAEHMQMFGMPNQWSVMGMMTIPIVPWSSKMYSTEVNSMRYQIQSMEQEKQTMELMAKRMLTEKQIMLNSANTQFRNYRNNIIPAYENYLQANLLAYRQNTGDLFVVLDSWDMLLMKKLESHDVLLNILNLEAEYEYENEIK